MEASCRGTFEFYKLWGEIFLKITGFEPNITSRFVVICGFKYILWNKTNNDLNYDQTFHKYKVSHFKLFCKSISKQICLCLVYVFLLECDGVLVVK